MDDAELEPVRGPLRDHGGTTGATQDWESPALRGFRTMGDTGLENLPSGVLRCSHPYALPSGPPRCAQLRSTCDHECDHESRVACACIAVSSDRGNHMGFLRDHFWQDSRDVDRDRWWQRTDGLDESPPADYDEDAAERAIEQAEERETSVDPRSGYHRYDSDPDFEDGVPTYDDD